MQLSLGINLSILIIFIRREISNNFLFLCIGILNCNVILPVTRALSTKVTCKPLKKCKCLCITQRPYLSIICYRKNYIFCGASNFEPYERVMSNNGILEIHEKKTKRPRGVILASMFEL